MRPRTKLLFAVTVFGATALAVASLANSVDLRLAGCSQRVMPPLATNFIDLLAAVCETGQQVATVHP